MVHNVKYSLGSKVTLVCCACGYQYEVGTFYITRFASGGGNMKCAICKSANAWKKKQFCTQKELDNQLWKKLVYIQNKEKFRPGRWKLNHRYKKFYDHLEEVSPELRAVLESKAGSNPVAQDEEESE